jgi:hypothetical protein
MQNNDFLNNKLFTHLVSFPVINNKENNIEVFLEFAATYHEAEPENNLNGRFSFEFVKVQSLWQNGQELNSFVLSNGEELVKDFADLSCYIDEPYCQDRQLEDSFHDFCMIERAKEFCF